MKYLSQHCIDTQIEKDICNRKVGKFLNYSNSDGVWMPINTEISSDILPENGLSKSNCVLLGFNNARVESSFANCSSNAIRSYFGNESCDGKFPVIFAFSLSDRPDIWVRFIALKTENPKIKISGNSYIWENAWKNVDLDLCVIPGKIKETIILNNRNTPSKFSFAIETAPGMSLCIKDNVIHFYDSIGNLVLETEPPHGIDSLSSDDKKCNAVKSILIKGDGFRFKNAVYPTFSIMVDEFDLDRFAYPIKIDPTTAVTGAANIQDVGVRGDAGQNNTGAAVSQYVERSPSVGRLLNRIDASLIPSGTLLSFYYNLYFTTPQYCPATLIAHRMADANTWVEGRGTATNVLAGESTWFWCQYNTQAWAGGAAGAFVSGTDYYADANPPSVWLSSGGNYNLKLPPTWAMGWKDGSLVNNGFCLWLAEVSRLAILSTSDNVTAINRPYFTFDYLGNLTGLNRLTVGADAAGQGHPNSIISNVKVYKRPTRK